MSWGCCSCDDDWGCNVSWSCSCDWNSVGWGCNVTGVPGWVPGAVCALGLLMCDVTGLPMWLGCDKVTGVSKGSRMMVLKGDDKAWLRPSDWAAT